MEYIVRYQDRRRGSKPRFWTTPPEWLDINFKSRYRRTGQVTGLGPILEETGKDKSTVTLRTRRRAEPSQDRPVRNAKGTLDSFSGLMFRLLDRHQHIRVLSEQDLELLADYDRQRQEILDRLHELEKERAQHVAEIWGRSEKVNINDLEEAAQ